MRFALLTAACLLAFAVEEGSSRGAPSPAGTPVVPGEVVVSFEPGASLRSAGIPEPSLLRQRRAGITTVAVPPGHEQQYADAYARRPGVRLAQPNYLYQPQFIPNDPDYKYQWDLPMIQAPDAWDVTRGEGVVIAVADTGVAFEDYDKFGRSPELSGALFVFPYNTANGGEHANDDNGHGTHVTGTIAQDTDNRAGTAGLAPFSAIMPVRVCELSGCASDAMAEGFRWAVDHGADVLNISLGGPTIGGIEREALAYAEEHDVVVVAAAGNGGGDFVGDPVLHYPAGVATVIAVGAVGVNGERTRYSNYGAGEGPGALHIMAPGGDNSVDLNDDGRADGIPANTYAHACGGGPKNYKAFATCFYNGTSMATPHVSAVAAMLLSRYPSLTAPEVRAVLGCSALDLGPPGVDPETGAGLVQAASALADDDGDGTPNCLEPRPVLEIVAGGGSVVPGGEIKVPVTGIADEAPIGSYDVAFSYDPNVLQMTGCQPRPGAVCAPDDDSVRISGAHEGGLAGTFLIGEVTFTAAGQAGLSTVLDLSGAAEGIGAADPPAQVTAHDAVIKVESVPQTVSGDVNCDGVVNAADVMLALRFGLALAAAFCSAYGDVNCSGLLDVIDVLAMLQFLASVIPAVPAGCPAIGAPP